MVSSRSFFKEKEKKKEKKKKRRRKRKRKNLFADGVEEVFFFEQKLLVKLLDFTLGLYILYICIYTYIYIYIYIICNTHIIIYIFFVSLGSLV